MNDLAERPSFGEMDETAPAFTTRPLGELVRRAPVACGAGAPVREALERMSAEGVRTVIVVDGGGAPVGMFTLVDLLRRVALAERPLATPLAEVMSAPAVTLAASASAYDALQCMAERGIRQIVVVDGRRAVGVVSERDLFALSRASMRQVIEGLRQADTPAALRRAADDIAGLTRSLLAQGVAAEPLTRTVATLNDALTRRTIESVAAAHDLSGLDWCWLALGSEGRGEQTFATDQDNAIVFHCGAPSPPRATAPSGAAPSAAPSDAAAPSGAAAAPEAARARLLAFAGEVNEALAQLGFPLCPGRVMAGNPELCLTVEEWKARFLEWIAHPTPAALLQANILFDFRALYGNASLADGLREWLFAYTRENRAFLLLMARNALQATPPLGLIRTFAVDDGPGVAGTLDLKVRGSRIFVDAARVWALELGIAETGTAARLRAAARAFGIDEREVEATLEGFHFIQQLRLRRQGRAAGEGDANRIDPAALNEVDQHMLKEAFRQARKLQQVLEQRFR
ncbi:MAG: hypothetical protein BGO72_10675 [Burkholderiales bacterium 70-64]|nr:MAG: hypothetical protein BGO72_10675 [Burkholderiales bacterium 70-64]